MKIKIKNWVKKYFNLFDQQDLEQAMAQIGNSDDRGHYEWQLKVRLFYHEKPVTRVAVYE